MLHPHPRMTRPSIAPPSPHTHNSAPCPLGAFSAGGNVSSLGPDCTPCPLGRTTTGPGAAAVGACTGGFTCIERACSSMAGAAGAARARLGGGRASQEPACFSGHLRSAACPFAAKLRTRRCHITGGDSLARPCFLLEQGPRPPAPMRHPPHPRRAPRPRPPCAHPVQSRSVPSAYARAPLGPAPSSTWRRCSCSARTAPSWPGQRSPSR